MDKESKILVTGATGMVGSYIIRNLLKNGYNNIIGCRRDSSNMNFITDFFESIEWVYLDILDHLKVYQVIESVDAVIHSAASVNLRESFNHLYKVNVVGTSNIINAALETNLQKLIYISTTAALGRKERLNYIDENQEWEFSKYNSDYAISKYHAELEVWRGIAEGLNAVILNPSFILGSGEWNKSSLQLIGKVDSGLWFYPSGSNGFVDVRDVAKAVHKLLNSDTIGERFIISAENISYQRMIEMISSNLGKKPPLYKFPYMIGYLGGKIGNILSWFSKDIFPVNMDMIRNLFSDNNYINNKSKQGLDMDYISIDHSVKDVVNAFRDPENKALEI